MDELTLDPAMSAAMSDLGIDQSRLDADEPINVEASSTDAEVETKEASEIEASVEVEGETTEGLEANAANPEGEENKEAPIEEPKLTAKEFQEIEQQKLAIETERKALTEERMKFETEFKKEYGEKLKAHDELDAFFVDLENADPDLYSLVKAQFGEFNRKNNNPQVASLKEEMSAIKAELNQFKSNATAEVTLTQMSAELDKLNSTLGKEIAAAGLKMDAQKVKDTWSKNPGLSIEQAAWVEYGPSLIKAATSKAKVEATERKLASRPTVKTVGTVASSKSSPAVDFSKMSVREVVEWEARQLRK